MELLEKQLEGLAVSSSPICTVVTARSEQLVACREVLQNARVLALDCEGADALFHILGIQLTNVHDTQCWQKAVSGAEPNLNDTLAVYGLQANVARNSSVYKENPAFWAVRPLTSLMITWASGDVALLIDLHENKSNALLLSRKALLLMHPTRLLVLISSFKIYPTLLVCS
ncbi:hypothetical protein EON65_44315 [archaeon]|nr:MAG: hypothetical protein EON65_44315 [archaeon]